ncbi:MAG TPA: hypothetical protein VHT68_11145 [Pseudolabrys sp.]|nr:hypothetical protein [Pseudolabrys sp.]
MGQIYTGDSAVMCLGQRSRWTSQTTPDVKNMRPGVQIHFLAQFQCRFPAADMKLVDRGEVGRCQFIEVFASALQFLRDCIGQFEVFAVMACYAIGHRPYL